MSRDAVSAVTLLVVFAVLYVTSKGSTASIHDYFALCLDYAQNCTLGQVSESFGRILSEGIMLFIKVVFPVTAAAAVAAVTITFLQTRLNVSGESLKPKFSRISPMQGIRRLFSLRSIIEALKGFIKIVILLYIIYTCLRETLPVFMNYPKVDIGQACMHLFSNTFSMIIKIIVAFVVLAAFDFLYQWWDYERQLRMTKQEIKEEFKQMEGDPQIKGKIKQMQRKIAQSRMMQQVPEADVVIRNPNHVAVALRYRPKEDKAPIVLAKGLDNVALRIVEVAQENQVSVVENVSLARSLYQQAELNQEIPADLYAAVADVIVYIFRLNEKI